jgi:hypothetical protein
MSLFTTLFACFVGSAIAKNVARQTSASSCTAFGPLLTSLPSVSPDFTSYWEKNNPLSNGCLAPLPTQFSSVQDEYKTWWHSHSSQFSSIASECGFGQFLRKRDIPTSIPIPTTSAIPSIPAAYSSLAGDISSLIDLTSLPAQFAQFASDFQPCSSTTGAGSLSTGITLSTPIGTPTNTVPTVPGSYPAVNGTGSGSSSTSTSVPLSKAADTVTLLASLPPPS